MMLLLVIYMCIESYSDFFFHSKNTLSFYFFIVWYFPIDRKPIMLCMF